MFSRGLAVTAMHIMVKRALVISWRLYQPQKTKHEDQLVASVVHVVKQWGQHVVLHKCAHIVSNLKHDV